MNSEVTQVTGPVVWTRSVREPVSRGWPKCQLGRPHGNAGADAVQKFSSAIHWYVWDRTGTFMEYVG